MTVDDLRRELEGKPGHWPVKTYRITVTETITDDPESDTQSETETDTELVDVLGIEERNDWHGSHILIAGVEP